MTTVSHTGLPAGTMPAISDEAWQAAFARRHGLRTPVSACRGPGLPPPEIAARGAIAVAQARAWREGAAGYAPCFHRDFYEAGLAAVPQGRPGHGDRGTP